jgi:RecA-family ATPase
MGITPKQYELLELLEQGANQDTWHDLGNLSEMSEILQDRVYKSRLMTASRKAGILREDFLAAVADATKRRNGQAQGILEPPETLTDLLAADIPLPIQLFDGLMHEGMLLFGGKSKRGKSWLMFDIALSLAVGRSAFRHFACKQKMSVLFLALEDGRARLQGRTKLIQPNLTQVDNFHLRYSFRPLLDGGIEDLTREIERYHYGLVVIDVLAKLEPHNGGKGEKNYHDVYEMFAPLQALRQQHPFCLAMLTHLRKQDAEDVFDSLHGSVAYQGAQDVLWVLERKPKDDFAFLHIRDKDAEDHTLALRFMDGHWEYVGEGEEYEITRDQRKVIKILTEEKRELSIQDILRGGDFKQEQYGYLRKLLVTMVKEDLIHRTRHGKYSATLRGSVEMGDLDDPEEIDDAGNRIPF